MYPPTMDLSSLLFLDPPLFSSCLLSYLLLTRATLPSGWEPPEDRHCSAHLCIPRGLSTVPWTLSVPLALSQVELKTGHPRSCWKPCPAPTYSGPAKLPALQSRQTRLFLCLPSKPYSVCKAQLRCRLLLKTPACTQTRPPPDVWSQTTV